MRILRFLREQFVHQLDLERKSIITAGSWGAWALIAHSFDSNPSFYLLNKTAGWFGVDGELFWGGLLLLGALLQLIGLRKQNDRMRMTASMMLCALWLLIGLQFFLYNERGMGVPTYLSFAYATGVLYFQLGTNRR